MRITTSIAMFYLWLTAAANLLIETGFTDAIGVSVQTSAGDSLQEAVQALGNIDPAPTGETLFGLFSAGSNAGQAFLAGVTAGPRLLANIGVPLEFVVFLHAPLGLLMGRWLLHVVTGRDP